jgi:hypothetical protein
VGEGKEIGVLFRFIFFDSRNLGLIYAIRLKNIAGDFANAKLFFVIFCGVSVSGVMLMVMEPLHNFVV